MRENTTVLQYVQKCTQEIVELLAVFRLEKYLSN